MSIIFDYADIAKRMKGELAPKPKPKVEEGGEFVYDDLIEDAICDAIIGGPACDPLPPMSTPTPKSTTPHVLGKRKLVS